MTTALRSAETADREVLDALRRGHVVATPHTFTSGCTLRVPNVCPHSGGCDGQCRTGRTVALGMREEVAEFILRAIKAYTEDAA